MAKYCCPNKIHFAEPHSPAGDQCIPQRRFSPGEVAGDAHRRGSVTWMLPVIPSPWEGAAWSGSREGQQEASLCVPHQAGLEHVRAQRVEVIYYEINFAEA